MKGPEVDGTVLLGSDMRLTSGVIQRPQPLRFTTEFKSGPQGYVLYSVDTDTGSGGNVKFAYTYQSVEGFQIPAQVTITPATTGVWQFSLTDCKVVRFVKVQTGLPKK